LNSLSPHFSRHHPPKPPDVLYISDQIYPDLISPHDNRPARSGNGNQSGGSSNGNTNGNGNGGGNGNGNNNANAGGHSHSHSQNLNVLRTIGNSLVANNQLNTYAGNAFG